MIYAGGGVINSGAAAELVELATSDRFPVTTTLMGLGGFPARTASGSACSGCTARGPPTMRWIRPI